VAALRAHLRSVGYDIPEKGATIGPKMKSALADYLKPSKSNPLSPNLAKALKGTVITGRRDPKAWSARFGSPKNRSVVQTTQVDAAGNAASTAPFGGEGAGGPSPELDFSALLAGVNAPATRIIPEAWASGGARLHGPDVAEQLAALQFDTAIRDLGVEKDRMGRTNTQNQTDIDHWYDQVLGSQKTAAQRDAAINEAGIDSIRDSGASILSAIGGEASEGAGMVGAANASAVGTLEALAANQESYNADLRPLLQAESAGAMSRERAMGTARSHELAQRLIGLQQDRGKAKAGFQFEIDRENNGILDSRNQRAMEIRNANNGIAQQNFQNALALLSAQTGAALTGAKIQNELADAADGGGGSTSYPFAKAPVSQRNDAYNQALSSIFSEGKLTTSIPRAVQLVNQVLAGYGWSRKNPAVKALRNQILQDAGIRPDPRWQ
jgi:hypothetical protein